MADDRILLLGPTRIEGAGGERFSGERACQLLGYLATQGGAWVERERLAALFWPEHSPADGRRNLRKVVFRAHAIAGVSGLEADDRGLRWDPSSDLREFGDALREGRTAHALALVRGPLLDGLEDNANPAWSEWLWVERARIATAWRQAALERIGQLGDDSTAIVGLADALLQADPLDEAALAALLRARVAGGHAARPAAGRGGRIAGKRALHRSAQRAA